MRGHNPGCKHHLYRNDSLGVRYGHSLGSRGQIWSHQVDTRPHRASVIGEWLLEPKVVLHGMWGHNPGCKHHLYRSDSYRYIEVRYEVRHGPLIKIFRDFYIFPKKFPLRGAMYNKLVIKNYQKLQNSPYLLTKKQSPYLQTPRKYQYRPPPDTV